MKPKMFLLASHISATLLGTGMLLFSAAHATFDEVQVVGNFSAPSIDEADALPRASFDPHAPTAQIIFKQESQHEKPALTPLKKIKKKKITFDYENEDLINVINYIASELGINIMLPQGADAINTKLSLAFSKKIPLAEGWQLLHTILDAAGYVIVPKADLYMIVKAPTKDVLKQQTLATYIGVAPAQLPASDETIRYLYYLANIRVSTDPNDEIKAALTAILPPTALVEVDTNANALLIVDKAQNIRAAMGIVIQLDQPGFQEKMEIIHLHNTDATTIGQLFTDQVLKTTAGEPNKYRLDAQKTTKDASYFASQTKVIPVPRTNSLLLLGRAQAIDRIKDFIFKYIDVELESGKSILHTIQLQYLDAAQLVEVLNSIVQSAGPAGAEQARAAQGSRGGAERFFAEKIYIKADAPMAGVGEKEKKYFGSNKLIIAARYDDWLELKKLIEQLDQPQPQVLIETLIADLTNDDLRNLGAFTRNPRKISLPNQVDFQAAMLPAGSPPTAMTNSWTAPVTIEADLLRKAVSIVTDPITGAITVTDNDAGLSSIAAQQLPGGMLLALNDNNGQTWSLVQMLKNLNITKILSMPHIMATHNKKASIENTDLRLLVGPVTGTDTAEIKYVPVTASLKIELTPRIISEAEVNLDIGITIQEFISIQNNRSTRTVNTITRVGNENILAIGGLIQTSSTVSNYSTPILSKIPILGWFFKSNLDEEIETNLTVFIKPTIIMPRFRADIGSYTKDYVRLAKAYADESSLFESLHDPITRWFFHTGANVRDEVKDFINKDVVIREELERAREEEIMQPNTAVTFLDKEAISANLKKQLNNQVPFEEFAKAAKPTNVAARQEPAFDKTKEAELLKRRVQHDNPFKKLNLSA
jgi:general secretion pathway protein D